MYRSIHPTQEADSVEQKTLSKEKANPTLACHLAEQVRAVADVVAASPVPLGLDALAAHFKGRGPWKKGLPTLLHTLEALGRVRALQIDGVTAWSA